MDSFIWKINNSIVTNVNGDIIKDRSLTLLVNMQHNIAYSVTSGIPRLLPGLAISLDQLSPGKSVE